MTAYARRRLLVVCFAASGAAALIYQVAWVRLLTLTLGHTVAATSTVLAAFMGGLAFGAWGGARISSRPRSLLTLYAGLELLVAAIAITLPALLAAFHPVLVAAYADGTRPAAFAIARVAISLLLIGIPASAMGATYPLVVAWLAHVDGGDPRQRRATSTAAGALYAANSAGAAAGAMAAGFWLIESLGIRATTWVAVALNVGAASVAWWIGRREAVPSTPLPGGRSRRRAPQVAPPVHARNALAAGAAACSGFAALVYEVAWTRLLALALGPTTYAFATMAAAFITGIAIGSAVGVRLGRQASAGLWLGTMLIGTAVCSTIAASFTASSLPLLIARDVAAGLGFGSLLVRQALAIALVLLPASVCLGATFTLALATAAPDVDAVATHTARVYTANTLGAVGGALIAGFLLVPRLGLQQTFLLASVVLFTAGMVVVGFGSETSGRRAIGRRVVPLLGAGVLAFAMFGVPDWDRDLMSSGAYKYARQFSAENFELTLRAGHLEYYKEGAAGTVSVRRLAGARSLAIDGKVDASNAGDMLTQRLLGLLPALLHAKPRDALVIGLGSGVTADAVLASGEVERLDIVEISREVADASAYFDRENRGVLKKPGVRLLIGDGRSHLRLSTARYDVIVSEPSNPWMAGVAALFTREFFEAAHARLRPGGIFCQWAHTYEIAETDLRSIVRTFGSVFPDGTMWLVGEGDLLLIAGVGTNMDARLAPVGDRLRMGVVPTLLADMGLQQSAAPFVLLSFFIAGPRELAAFGREAALQTDDRMSLEFTAARAMYAPPSGSAQRVRALAADAEVPAVVASRTRNASAEDWTARGAASLRAGAFDVAHESFRHALSLDSHSPEALRGATEAAAGANGLAAEAEWLKALAAAEPSNAAARVELSHVLATLGRTDEAIAAAEDARRIDPTHAEPLEQLASVLADVGDSARLMPVADELIARFPAREEGRFYKATALFLERRIPEARTALDALMKMNPAHAKGHNLRGVLCAALNDAECTRAAFTESARLNPRDPSAYINLGYFHLEQGDAATAIDFFSEALALDATAAAARQGLTDARAAQKP